MRLGASLGGVHTKYDLEAIVDEVESLFYESIANFSKSQIGIDCPDDQERDMWKRRIIRVARAEAQASNVLTAEKLARIIEETVSTRYRASEYRDDLTSYVLSNIDCERITEIIERHFRRDGQPLTS